MNRYVCVHGHFYQPPRENAWLETIEQQESAYPYHDWNERISAECYGPNAHARILGPDDRIVRIVNNYSNISFNFGPTLLSWMEQYAPEPYARILEADRSSITRFGHGSALAQAYNHIIMPLANERDRRTQILWGLRDFEARFGRSAEGMWLPETAVNVATLEALAASGVKFTILAPRQAAAIREPGSDSWTDVTGSRVDPRRPYVCHLPSGASIALFFYDGPVSRAVAFEALLESGERLARRLLDPLSDDATPQLAHIATDGETYGHHHRHGEMALAWALRQIDISGIARLTNYASFLAAHPPDHAVRVVDESSWSCVHGVERWRSDCGCHAGGKPGWNQAWRTPLRDAFDWLRDAIAPRFEDLAAGLVADPWAARDAYIDIVLDRSDQRLRQFVATHATQALDEARTVTLLKLLEMQRHAMLMYTSCGWFFNDVSGIETVQVLQYAGRAAQLGDDVFGTSLEAEFLERLESVLSNVTEERDARRIYEVHVRPTRVNLFQVVAHRAVSSAFESATQDGRVYCYDIEPLREDSRRANGRRLLVGRARVTSRLTRESETVSYAVLHMGHPHVQGGIRRHEEGEEWETRARELYAAFERGDLARVTALLGDFPDYAFSLRSLFADRQREILYRLLEARIDAAEAAYRTVYDASADLMRYLIELELPVPRALSVAAEFVLNRDLRRALGPAAGEPSRIRSLLDAARDVDVELDQEGLAYAAARGVATLVDRFARSPDTERLEQLADFVKLVAALPFEADLWTAQNGFYALVEQVLPQMRTRAEAGEPDAIAWVERFRAVGDQLAVAVP